MARVSLGAALFALASCASTRPVVYSDSKTVSAADIQIAIGLVQQRCLHERRGFLPVYRVDVDRFDHVFIHCGPHYGVADASDALTFTLEREQGTWHITGVSQYTPNPERVIITERAAMPGLTNRWSQPLAVAMRAFNFMKQFSTFATLVAASGGSAPSR